MSNWTKSFASLSMFFMIFLSYMPLVDTIGDLAGNATTTNAIITFFNSWFGIFWALLACVFLAATIYFAVESIS